MTYFLKEILLKSLAKDPGSRDIELQWDLFYVNSKLQFQDLEITDKNTISKILLLCECIQNRRRMAKGSRTPCEEIVFSCVNYSAT